MCVFASAYACACAYICACVCVYFCACVCVCVCVYVCVCICVYVCVCISRPCPRPRLCPHGVFVGVLCVYVCEIHRYLAIDVAKHSEIVDALNKYMAQPATKRRLRQEQTMTNLVDTCEELCDHRFQIHANKLSGPTSPTQ